LGSGLIPTFFLILGTGYQPERVQAEFYLLFYTLLTSLRLLVGISFVPKEITIKMAAQKIKRNMLLTIKQ